MNKLPGKTIYSGRRRTVTRSSGFKSHPNSTGGEYREGSGKTFKLPRGASLKLTFILPTDTEDHFSGFGLYFRTSGSASIRVENPNTHQSTFAEYPTPDWSKVGSIWKSARGAKPISVSFS